MTSSQPPVVKELKPPIATSSGHARLSPSDQQWPNCPGSVREQANYPDIAGAAAIDGTGSHLLLEMCLNENIDADTYNGQIIGIDHPDQPNGWMVHLDRCERVQQALDYIDRRKDELIIEYPGATVTVEAESKSNPGGAFGRNDWHGTCDITITVTIDTIVNCLFIEGIDYKDGRMWVGADDNTQLISYLFGKMRPFVCSGPNLVRPFNPSGVGKCRMTIIQPKTSPCIRYADVEPADVIASAEELNRAAILTDDPNAPLISGKWCKKWCSHKPNCNAETTQSLTVIEPAVDMSSVDLLHTLAGNPADKTNDQLSTLADCEAGMMSAFDKIKVEIKSRIEKGETVSGYAMVPGRAARKWVDDEAAIVKMLKGRRLKKDQISPPKLITFPALEKSGLLDVKQLKTIEAKYVASVTGKDMLKQVAHKLENDVADMFTNVEQSTTLENDEPIEAVSFF